LKERDVTVVPEDPHLPRRHGNRRHRRDRKPKPSTVTAKDARGAKDIKQKTSRRSTASPTVCRGRAGQMNADWRGSHPSRTSRGQVNFSADQAARRTVLRTTLAFVSGLTTAIAGSVSACARVAGLRISTFGSVVIRLVSVTSSSFFPVRL